MGFFGAVHRGRCHQSLPHLLPGYTKRRTWFDNDQGYAFFPCSGKPNAVLRQHMITGDSRDLFREDANFRSTFFASSDMSGIASMIYYNVYSVQQRLLLICVIKCCHEHDVVRITNRFKKSAGPRSKACELGEPSLAERFGLLSMFTVKHGCELSNVDD
jgi:hypothetical protein